MTDPEVDAYIARSSMWRDELAAVRTILIGVGLEEAIAWRKPCFRDAGRNIAILQEMKGFLALLFFKGALVPDPHGVLEAQGPNSRASRRICFRSIDDVIRLADVVATCARDAIAVEDAGLELGPPPELVLVAELADRLAQDAELRTAFGGLTAGRRREYHLYISDAKQSATRVARIDKCVPRILGGRGLRDR